MILLTHESRIRLAAIASLVSGSSAAMSLLEETALAAHGAAPGAGDAETLPA